MAKVKLSVYTMKTYRGSGGIAPLILNIDIRGCEGSTSSPGRMTPGKNLGEL